MKLLKITAILLTVFIFSCNKVEIPIKKQTNTFGEEGEIIRKILVEDYTGHKCNNCPSAAEILHNIIQSYGAYVVPVAVHVSGFAAPSSSGPFINDYRTEAGNELDAFFEVSNQGLPNGLVNRKTYDNSLVVSKNNWESAVNSIFNIPADAYIKIESSYNENTKEIVAKLSTEFFFDINENMNIGLYITEDSIISPQITPNGIEDYYVHKHMLRKAIHGAFGENFLSSAKEGDIFEKTYTFTANDDWNINHCDLVAFISNTETKEIIQAESEHIIH